MECKDIGEGGVTLYVVRRLAHYRHGLPDGLESESLLWAKIRIHHISSIFKQLYEKATAATARFTSLRSDSYKPPDDLVILERVIQGTEQCVGKWAVGSKSLTRIQWTLLFLLRFLVFEKNQRKRTPKRASTIWPIYSHVKIEAIWRYANSHRRCAIDANKSSKRKRVHIYMIKASIHSCYSE